jgi:hypothetical protein
MTQGWAVHEAVAFDLTQVIETQEKAELSMVLDVFGDSFDVNVEEEGGATELEWNNELLTGGDARKAAGAFKDEGLVIQKLHHDIHVDTLKPIKVETRIDTIVEGIPFQTVIDLEEEDEIADHKLAKTTRIWPHWITQTGFYRLVSGKPSRIEILRKGKNPLVDVKGHEPYSDSNVDKYKSLLVNVKDSIMRNMTSPGPDHTWTPNGAHTGSCNICSFKDRCPFSTATR